MPFPALLALIGPAVKGISKAVKAIKAGKAVRAAMKAGKAAGALLKKQKPQQEEATVLPEVVVTAPRPQQDLQRQLFAPHAPAPAGMPPWALPAAGIGAGVLLLAVIATRD